MPASASNSNSLPPATSETVGVISNRHMGGLGGLVVGELRG